MNCISWNCQGLGNPSAVQALKELIRREAPNVVFLMETKKTHKEWDRLKVQLGTKNCLAVDCEGRRGGLALLWDDKTDLTIQSFFFFAH